MLIKREGTQLKKAGMERQIKTVDMVTRLYVYLIRSEGDISSQEVNVLYSLLVNMFLDVDISWEVYLREIIESDYDIDTVYLYINLNLNQLDKTRIILSLIIMAITDGEIRVGHRDVIKDLAQHFHFNPDGFLRIMDEVTTENLRECKLPCEQGLNQIKNSIFNDFVTWGRGSDRDIRFDNPNVTNFECFLFGTDKYMFVGTGAITNCKINGVTLEANSLYPIPKNGFLSILEQDFDQDVLWKIYHSNDEDDEIAFQKASYDFALYKRGNQYSILVNSGKIALNHSLLQHGKNVDLVYDDELQIEGYASFRLLNVIRDRALIGVDDLVPSELFICADRDFYVLSRIDNEHSIARIEVDKGRYYLYPPKRGWTIFLNQQKLEELSEIVLNSDTITINKRNFRINSFYDLIESPFEIGNLSVQDIKHYFKDKILALDGVSFNVTQGQLVGILGQSGCGKSTLLKVINAELVPTFGDVKLDGKSVFSNLNYYSQFFGYVPQEDLLYPNLSVYENLLYRGRLRMPLVSKVVLAQKISNILHQVNLLHRKSTIVGVFKTKHLSGGERKRLNIALELLFEPTLIICDEPTSGLSFTDAEQIIDILKDISSQGKLVIITIHQPNSSVFKKLDRVMLMDMGGRQAYFGTPTDCYSYFDDEINQVTRRKQDIMAKRDAQTSDFMYDIITYPEYNEAGEPVYEQIRKVVQIKRKFPPEYWRDKYKRKMLYKIITQESAEQSIAPAAAKIKRRKLTPRAYLAQLMTFIIRSFLMKMRNRTNNIITFVEAPLLGLIIAFILRFTPTETSYSYHANNNIGIYIFVSIIAFIFMGMSNSIEEILTERKIIQREKLMNQRVSFYLASKLLVLALFTAVQVLLYTLVANQILEIRGVTAASMLYFFLAGMTGVSLGLVVSAFIRDNRAIVNILPLILIPQILFGGAVIEFEKMNQRLTLMEKSPIPEVVAVIPSRWLFEGLFTSYARNTVYHRKLNQLQKKELTLSKPGNSIAQGTKSRLEIASELYEQRLKVVRRWNPDEIMNRTLSSAVGLLDGRFDNLDRNVFLSSYKKTFLGKTRTWNFNAWVIALYLMVFNLITLLKLKLFFKE